MSGKQKKNLGETNLLGFLIFMKNSYHIGICGPDDAGGSLASIFLYYHIVQNRLKLSTRGTYIDMVGLEQTRT